MKNTISREIPTIFVLASLLIGCCGGDGNILPKNKITTTETDTTATPTTTLAEDEVAADTEQAKFLSLYKSLKAAGLSDALGWNDQKNIREWPGVTVDEKGFITSVNASFLASSSPAAFIGTTVVLPKEFFSMKKLTRLNLEGIEFDSPIPTEIGQAKSLKTLKLSGCFATHGGAIPTELGNLVNLDTLDLGLNFMLSGMLPASLSNLVNLKYLNLTSSQHLTGTIPAQMGKMASLTYVNFESSGLTGNLPVEWCNNNLLKVVLSDDGDSLLSCAQ